ncbi:MAG: pyridoxal phosphate-dependent aminotransferase [Patescibacteria group bacterium]|nr:pyridoxal phosphate-dependent aminotransferase [Patescibacteria group bacterium]
MKNNSLIDYSLKKNKNINSYVKKSEISAIKEIAYLAEKEKQKGKNIVSLSVGVPFYKMPKYIKDHVIKTINEKEDIDKYTFFPGILPLRKKIAEKISFELKIPTSPDEIVITAGSMMALKYATNVLINKDDEVIVFSPYFSSYKEQITLTGGKIKEIPLKINKNKNDFFYSIDLKKTEKTINKKTKAIIVNSPNNPTGTVYNKEELIKLAKIIKKNNLYLITDEVYDYLIFDNISYFNIASISWLWPKVIRCFSFSKKYGMTGWRVGYLHTNKELVNQILKIHDATIVCNNHLSQEAALAALSKNENEDDDIKNYINILNKNREIMINYLGQMKNFFSYNKPQGGYYVFVKYKYPLKSKEMAKKILYEAGVAVVPGIGFGKTGEYHLRFSFCQKTQEIIEALERIKKFINLLKK